MVRAGLIGCSGLLAVIILAVVAMAMVGGGSPVASPQTRTVTYRVTAQGAPAVITYANTQGGSESVETRSTKWEETLTLGDGAQFEFGAPQVQAQLQGNGTVTCEVLVDGKSQDMRTSRGEYQIALCSGNL